MVTDSIQSSFLKPLFDPAQLSQPQLNLAQFKFYLTHHKLKIKLTLHAVFFTSILFISILSFKYEKNKHNLSITKAQILPKDQLKNEQNQAWAYYTLVVIVGIWKINFLSTCRLNF